MTTGGSERAAPPAGEPGEQPVIGHDQQLDGVLAGRGSAVMQACHGQPARCQITGLGRQALLARRYPAPDDRSRQFAHPCGGQGVRIGDEAAGETVPQPGRKDSHELRDAVLMPAGNQRLRLAPPGSPGALLLFNKFRVP